MRAVVTRVLDGIEILRVDGTVECWRCGNQAHVFGYPYGRDQEPNCLRCIQEELRYKRADESG